MPLGTLAWVFYEVVQNLLKKYDRKNDDRFDEND